MNGDNFLRWSLSVQMNIRGRGKLGYLNGQKIKPAERCTIRSLGCRKLHDNVLVNSTEEEMATNYLGYFTAKEMLENLHLKINEAK